MPALYHDENGIPHKFCPKCKTDYEYPEKHFSKDSTAFDKLQYNCNACKSKQSKKWLQEHYVEKLAYNNQRQKKQRRINPEPLRAYRREYEKRPEYQVKRKRYDAVRKNTEHYREISRQSRRRIYARNPAKDIELTMRRNALKKKTATQVVDYNTILQRDGMFCYICEQDILPSQKIHFDHVVPLTRNGTHTEDNIKVTHAVCNQRKNRYLLSELTKWQRRGLSDV